MILSGGPVPLYTQWHRRHPQHYGGVNYLSRPMEARHTISEKWLGLQVMTKVCRGWQRQLLLILKILHDLHIPQSHNSQGTRYLGSCRIFSIHCIGPKTGFLDSPLRRMDQRRIGVPQVGPISDFKHVKRFRV